MAWKAALMLMVDETGQGVMIADGKSYAVKSSYTQQSFTGGMNGVYRQRWDINVDALKSLDEEAQARRIAGLERQLEREREIMGEIRAALAGGSDDE